MPDFIQAGQKFHISYIDVDFTAYLEARGLLGAPREIEDALIREVEGLFGTVADTGVQVYFQYDSQGNVQRAIAVVRSSTINRRPEYTDPVPGGP